MTLQIQCISSQSSFSPKSGAAVDIDPLKSLEVLNQLGWIQSGRRPLIKQNTKPSVNVALVARRNGRRKDR